MNIFGEYIGISVIFIGEMFFQIYTESEQYFIIRIYPLSFIFIFRSKLIITWVSFGAFSTKQYPHVWSLDIFNNIQPITSLTRSQKF